MTTDIIKISDSSSGATATIAPKLGFNCFSFQPQVAGQSWETLWSDPQFTEGTTRPSRSGIPLLFPFPGRLRGDKLNYQGRTFQFDVFDPNGNAIHGFVYTRAWRVIAQTADSVTGEFQASIDDPTLLSVPRWPCDFRIRATYQVSGNKLRGDYEISNVGTGTLPWGFGTHPYFRVPLGNGVARDCIVTMPLAKRWELANALPTGRLLEEAKQAEYAAGFPFADEQFDTIFAGLKIEQGVWTGSVTDPNTKFRTTVRFGAPFRECVVFTPPHREAICLEPYSCTSNAYELREQGIDAGLQELAPGASVSLAMEVEGSIVSD